MVVGAESRVQVPGGRLRMRVDGPAGAPWLVFSNSLATDLALWDPQVAAFALRYRMLRYDYRGHGGSDPGSGEFGPDVLADDLLAVMQAAAVNCACHVGTSMGALAGLAAAARMPQRFDRLVLCGARLASSAVAAADLESRAGVAQAQGMEALVDATLAKWFGASNPAPALRSRVAAMIRATDAQSFAAYARGMRDYDFSTMPQAPVLLMAGGGDAAVAAAFAATAARDASVEFRLIEDAGHLPNIEAADQFNAALTCFARGLEGDGCRPGLRETLNKSVG